MQIFRCPFCGPRDETEFHFMTEAGKTRPEPSSQASDEEWSHYLYMNRSPEGLTTEIWLHTPCGELFMMERDTCTREVVRSVALGT